VKTHSFASVLYGALVAFPFAPLAAAAVTEAWVQRYNKLVTNAIDSAVKVVRDSAGDIIVTGATGDGSTGRDILTFKYSGVDGSVVWQRQYNGAANLDDDVHAAAVDASGNVVVTGSTGTSISQGRYLRSVFYTAKYAATNGALLWEQFYHGHPIGRDFASAVAVDSNGNVVVTGSSWDGESHYDYYTAKYAEANGALLWEKRYKGPADADDPVAVAVDGSGNVVVTGTSWGGVSGNDYYTAKYAAADGALVWEKRYDGNGDASARAMAMDGSGNVVVTGFSEGNSNNYDYYTAKYAAADGALLWEKRYNGPANNYDWAYAVAVDGSGNVVVTGASVNGIGYADYYTAKYAAANGALLWEKRYNAPENKNDQALAVAVDGSGNVMVTGASDNADDKPGYYTAKYAAADGALLWEKRYHGPENNYDSTPSVAVDGNGNVVVTGASVTNGLSGVSADFYTAKYNAMDGALLWEKRYNGLVTYNDEGRAVAMDLAGNVVVAGCSRNGNISGYYTAKYAAANGSLIWERHGPDYSFDEARAIAVDRNGNVIVTGSSELTAPSFHSIGNYYTAKYAAADGALLWEKNYNGPADREDSEDHARAIAVDGSGDVIVTGGSYRNGTGYDYYTVKYAAANGAVRWEKRYDGPGPGWGDGHGRDDVALAVAVDSRGNVVVTGFSNTNSHFNYYTAKYAAADGAVLWERRLNRFWTLWDPRPTVAVDGNDNVVLGGSSHNGTNFDYYAAKLAATNGAILWEKIYNGSENLDDYATAVAVDTSGNVFLTGIQNADSGTGDYYTAKYAASDGMLLWSRNYNGPNSDKDHALAIAVDAAGDAIVTGSSENHACTIKYAAADGALLWEKRSNHGMNGKYVPSGLALGPNGMVAITGTFIDETDNRGDYFTIVYRESISIEQIPSGIRLRFTGTLGQNYNIERARSINGPWTTNATLAAPTNGIIEYVDTNAPPGSAFYRTSTP